MSDLRVAEIKRLLQAQCPGLIHELVPNARREGRVFSAPNPTRGKDTHGSFKIWFNGAWREYDEAADVGKGDIIGLIAYVGGYPPKSSEGRKYAISWAKQRLGLAGASRATIEKAKRQASFARKVQEDSERRRAEFLHRKMLDIRVKSKPVAPGDIVDRYIKLRLGIDLFAIKNRCPSLRLHGDLEHWACGDGERWRGPAMIGCVVDAQGYTRGIHCTFIDLDNPGGKFKAPIANAKLMLGDIKGNVVPLTYGPSGLPAFEAAARGIAEPVDLTEGIETGIADALGCSDADGIAQARVWACLSLSNIGNAPVDLACVSAIVVSSENDLKPQAVRQRDDAILKLEAHGKPLVLKRVHEGSDAAELLEG